MPSNLPDSTSAPPKWIERDRSLARLLHRATASPWLVLLLRGVSRLSDGLIWYAVVLALPLFGGATGTACALRLVLLGAVNLTIYRIVKRHFARARPFMACPGVTARARCLDEHSFPSGHSLHALAFGTMLHAYYPAFGWAIWPFVGLVMLSRVVLGLHYPSDVLVGAAIGWFTSTCVLVLF